MLYAPFLRIEEKIMTSDRLKEIVELVAVFSIVASLIFVGLQVRQDREIAATESVAAAADSRKYMAELISDNTEVWVSGLAGKPLSDLDTVVFASMADAYQMDVYASWFRASQLNHINPDRFPLQFASYLIRNPGLLANWHKRNARAKALREYDGVTNYLSWNRLIEEALGRLQERPLQEIDGDEL
jgi:hypothetical protein